MDFYVEIPPFFMDDVYFTHTFFTRKNVGYKARVSE
jgi:hypothetical protein